MASPVTLCGLLALIAKLALIANDCHILGGGGSQGRRNLRMHLLTMQGQSFISFYPDIINISLHYHQVEMQDCDCSGPF